MFHVIDRVHVRCSRDLGRGLPSDSTSNSEQEIRSDGDKVKDGRRKSGGAQRTRRCTSYSVIICYPSFVTQRSMYAAEDKVLEYIKRVKSISRSSLTHLTSITQMNRPFGAVDVSANLKGAVPKTATQKILVALAEKGELVQKTYGTFHHSFFALRILEWMYAIYYARD